MDIPKVQLKTPGRGSSLDFKAWVLSVIIPIFNKKFLNTRIIN